MHCSYIYKGKSGVQESIPWQSSYGKHSTSIDKAGRKSLYVNNPIFSHTVQSHYSLRGFTVCMYIWLFCIQTVGQIRAEWMFRQNNLFHVCTLHLKSGHDATSHRCCPVQPAETHTPRQEKTIKKNNKHRAVFSRIDVTLCPRAILQR